MKFTTAAYLIATGAILAGCGDIDFSEPDYVAQDAARCTSLGFETGSQALATCMGNASASRDAEALREQQWRENYEAREQKKREEKKKKKHAAEAQPSASGIAGMECAGSGASAACDAYSEY